jgi:hypothetical protein
VDKINYKIKREIKVKNLMSILKKITKNLYLSLYINTQEHTIDGIYILHKLAKSRSKHKKGERRDIM